MSAHEPNIPLDIKDLHVEFRTRDSVVKAVNGLDLRIRRGKALGLVGETGAGKTTTGLAVLGLIPSPPGVVTGGEIYLNGENLLQKGARALRSIRGKQVSMIFQDPMTSLNPVLPVNEQIAEVIRTHNKGMKAKEAAEKAGDMLELVGIPRERGGEYPHQFSGGMKQRVVIAIALACQPDVLIADEPTTALDVTIQAQVLEMMKELKDRYGTSMLMITHDLGIVADICDEVSVIYAGRVVEHGTLEDVFDHTLHPYTIGLFGSLPNMEDRSQRLKPIKGLMPDPSDLPKGCAFCPRCDRATGRCETEKPGRVWTSDTHFVECHLYTECQLPGEEADSHA
ncbi:MAG: ABC transporter ATP-binding protein [Lawsonibacter sp.]|nr:ABC transporter ATP-binding protein [Lawsonibacter sp.]